jgi:hypothetical protein
LILSPVIVAVVQVPVAVDFNVAVLSIGVTQTNNSTQLNLADIAVLGAITV